MYKFGFWLGKYVGYVMSGLLIVAIFKFVLLPIGLFIFNTMFDTLTYLI